MNEGKEEWVPVSGEEWDGTEDGSWVILGDTGEGMHDVIARVPGGKDHAETICFLYQQRDNQWGAADEFGMAQLENRISALCAKLNIAKELLNGIVETYPLLDQTVREQSDVIKFRSRLDTVRFFLDRGHLPGERD